MVKNFLPPGTFSFVNIQSNWNVFKVLKLSLALLVMVQAAEAGDAFLGVFGLVFFSQAILNIGCCGPQGCAVPITKKDKNTNKDITFVEVNNNTENKKNEINQ